jgi:signal transduction histidine kinase
MVPRSDSIRGRLRLVTGTIGALLVVLSAVSWWTTARITGTIRRTLAAAQGGAALSAEFTALIGQELFAAKRYIESRDPVEARRFDMLSHRAHENYRRMNRDVGQTPDETALIASIDANLSLAETHYARAHRLADLGREAEARREVERADPAIEALLGDVQRLGEMTARKVQDASTRLQRDTRRQQAQFAALLLGALLLAAGLSRLVGRSIARPLDALVAHARSLSEGDFGARTVPDPMPREFRVLAEGMNRAAASLALAAQTEANLRQAEKLAAVGQLVSGVAHQLSAPLAAALSSVENLLEQQPDEQARGRLVAIREQVIQTRRIVRDLVAFAGGRRAAAEPVPPASLVAGALESIAEPLQLLEVRVVRDVPAGLPRLLVDRVGIEQVLANLVLNGARYAGRDGVVRITARGASEGCEFIVEDTGPGIPPHILPRIFEPFFTTSADQEGGAGLGRSAALGIVEQHGGTLRVESDGTPGGGARFIAQLPCAYDTAEHRIPHHTLSAS